MAKQFRSGKEMGIKIFQLSGVMDAYNNQASPFFRHREPQTGPTGYRCGSARLANRKAL